MEGSEKLEEGDQASQISQFLEGYRAGRTTKKKVSGPSFMGFLNSLVSLNSLYILICVFALLGVMIYFTGQDDTPQVRRAHEEWKKLTKRGYPPRDTYIYSSEVRFQTSKWCNPEGPGFIGWFWHYCISVGNYLVVPCAVVLSCGSAFCSSVYLLIRTKTSFHMCMIENVILSSVLIWTVLWKIFLLSNYCQNVCTSDTIVIRRVYLERGFVYC